MAVPVPQHSRSDFRRFWLGQTISNFGSSFSQFALPLLVYRITGSALNLGIASAATFLPYLLFGLLIGAWVDRVDRRRLMIGTDLARAAITALIPLLSAFNALSVWWIYGATFALSTLTIFFNTAEFAAIPSLVARDDLVRANGRIQASYSAASIAGPLLAGVLVALMPLSTILLIDAASYLISSLSLSLVIAGFNGESGGARTPTSVRRDVADGLRYVLGHPVLRTISAMMALVNLVGSTTGAQLVLFAKHRLAASDTQVAILYAAGSVGIVVLSLAAGPLRARWSFSRVALGALMLEGLLTVAMAATSAYWVALVLWSIASGVGILFNINTGSLRQAIVPDHMLGRVMSIAGVLAWSAIPVGTFAGGLLIQRLGPDRIAIVYAGIGALTFLIPLCFSFTALGHADRYLPASPDARSEDLREGAD